MGFKASRLSLPPRRTAVRGSAGVAQESRKLSQNASQKTFHGLVLLCHAGPISERPLQHEGRRAKQPSFKAARMD
jgi:hypothetical protein